jgi:hypothetical protein
LFGEGKKCGVTSKKAAVDGISSLIGIKEDNLNPARSVKRHTTAAIKQGYVKF